MTTVIYNFVIDAQARVGSMGAVSLLVKCMCQDGCVLDATTNSTIVKGSAKGDLLKPIRLEVDVLLELSQLSHL